MDFGFNDEYKMIQKMYREFAEKEIKPLAEEIDENERFPKESVQKMADNGMLGIPFPEEYGGEEGDYLSYVIAVEELSKVCASTGVTLSAHTSLGSAPIYDWGTEEQKQKYLTRLASGECLGAFGLTEPNAGTDASRQKTTAVKKGDHYVLNGSKCFITNAGEAEIYVVMAMTDKEKGNHGISAFIVEDGFEGFSIGKHEKKMGIRGSATASLVFEDCIVPAENLLGEEGQGFKVAMHTLDVWKASVCLPEYPVCDRQPGQPDRGGQAAGLPRRLGQGQPSALLRGVCPRQAVRGRDRDACDDRVRAAAGRLWLHPRVSCGAHDA